MVEFFKDSRPEVVSEPAELLLELPEAVLDAEPFGIKFYDLHGGKSQIRACKYALRAIVGDEHEPKLAVQPHAPKEIPAAVFDFLRLPIYLCGRFREGGFIRKQL